MQRHAAFAIPFGPGNLGAVQASRDIDPHALRTETHGIGHGALHGPTEHDAALQLLGDALGHELGVQFRLADLLDIDVHRDTHQLGDFLAQLLDILALLADHDAGARGVDGNQRIPGGPLDLDPAHRRMGQALLQKITHLEIVVQIIREVLGIGVPLRCPILHDTEADTRWMYFLAHVGLSIKSLVSR